MAIELELVSADVCYWQDSTFVRAACLGFTWNCMDASSWNLYYMDCYLENRPISLYKFILGVKFKPRLDTEDSLTCSLQIHWRPM